MILFKFLLILQAFSMYLSYDLELQGFLKLGSEFFNTLGANSDMRNTIFTRNDGKISRKFGRSSIMRATLVQSNRSEEIMEYIEHIKRKGVKALTNMGRRIMKVLDLGNEHTAYINIISDEYKTLIQNYTEYIAAEKTLHVIDEEITLLDMVETSCRLLGSGHKKLLDKAVMLVHSNKKDSPMTLRAQDNDKTMAMIQMMSQVIFEQSIKIKKEELRYICNNYNICKHYPAATDYFGDFILQILKLSDMKLKTFIKFVKELVENNENFFKKIMEEDDRELLIALTKENFKTYNSIHASLKQLRALFTERFKIIHSSDLKLKIKTQAIRIIFEIMNKAFDYEYDDAVLKDIGSTVLAIRNWVRGDIQFPDTIIRQTFNNMIEVLEVNLTKTARKEISVLIETVFKGSSKDELMHNKLFREGSQYVQGKDSSPNLDIL